MFLDFINHLVERNWAVILSFEAYTVHCWVHFVELGVLMSMTVKVEYPSVDWFVLVKVLGNGRVVGEIKAELSVGKSCSKLYVIAHLTIEFNAAVRIVVAYDYVDFAL